MCRCFESIKLKDGVFYRLKWHQKRVNKAFSACFPNEEPFSVSEILYSYSIPQEGIYKCRIVYDVVVQSVEIIPYVHREIHSLKLVETDLESHDFKLEDRTGFNDAFAKRGDCDDVLLVKEGLLTDTSFSNIALFDGEKWVTPRLPLLYGTNRDELLNTGKLTEKDISVLELKKYKQIALFNAIIEFGEIVLDTSVIVQK